MKFKYVFPLLTLGIVLPLAVSQSYQNVNAAAVIEFTNKEDYVAHATKISTQICEEGFVLLKNDGFLPMKKGSKISIAGKNSSNPVRGSAAQSASIVNPVKYVSLEDSLTNAGFNINNKLLAFYKNSTQSGRGRTNGNSGWTGVSQFTVGETPLSSYSNEVLDSLKQYNDVAIQVISREGNEGVDLKASDARDNDSASFSHKHALELSDNEQALFGMLKQNFDHIIILINSGSIFECTPFENDPKVSAIIWMGTAGATGMTALGEILNGSINPSGHTVDTWPRDLTKDPTFQNFGDNSQTNLIKDGSNEKYVPRDTMFNQDGTPVKDLGTHNKDITYVDEANKVVSTGLNGTRPSAFVSYEEGVYVDYRYYETKYADMAKENKEAADNWYNGAEGVSYPFGYGLSYTTFFQQFISSNYPENFALNENSKTLDVKVKVTNTGKVAGKEVVQLYWKAPYKAGEIEKPYEVLCAFDKTNLLNPGESQTLKLSVNLQDIANYDFNDANKNGFMGYELDAGEYTLSLNKNAHEVLDELKFQVASGGIKYQNDRYTGNKVENRFTNNGFYNSLPSEHDVKFTQMSRRNFGETSPSHPTIADSTLDANSQVEEYLTHEFSIADVDVLRDARYMSQDVYVSEEDFNKMNISQSAERLVSDQRMIAQELEGVPLDDPRWDTFLNDFTYSELLKYVTGSMNTPSNNDAKITLLSEGAGTCMFSIMWWPSAPIIAATYNVKLAEAQGKCIGEEAHLNSKGGWWGPNAAIRRSPFGGLNDNFYSSDPLLTGKCVSSVVREVTKKGVWCCVKQFALQEQEKNREGLTVYVSEQALRELYLKGFQYAVEEGQTTGILTSYCGIGLVDSAANYELLTNVLRKEWGFKGAVLGEMVHTSNPYVNFNCYENINARILAGLSDNICQENMYFKNHVNCSWDQEARNGQGAPVFTYGEKTYISYTWWCAMRESAKQRMWTSINFSAHKNNKANYSKDIQIESDRFEINVGEQFSTKVTVNGGTPSIDATTPLPDGLTFSNNTISGTPTKAGIYSVDIRYTVGEEKFGKTILFVVSVKNVGESETSYPEKSIPSSSEPNSSSSENGSGTKKSGCNGSILASASISLLLLVGGLITVLSRKREE